MVLGAPEAIAFLTFAAQATKVLITFYDGVKSASKDIKKLREELSSFCFLVTSLANLLQSSDQYSSRSGTTLSRSIAVYLDNALSQLVQDLQEYGEFLHAMDPTTMDPTGSASKIQKTWSKIKWVYGQNEAEKFSLKLLRHKTSLSLAFAAAQSEQLHAIQQTMATAEKLDELLSMLTVQQNTLTSTSTTVQESPGVTHVSEVQVVESVISQIIPPPEYAEAPPSYISSQEAAQQDQEDEQGIEEVQRDVKRAPRKSQPTVKQSSKAVITRSDTHRFKFPFGELKVTLSDVTKNVSDRFTQKQYKVNFLFIPTTIFDNAVEGGWTSWRNLRGSLSVSPHLGCRKVVAPDSAIMKLAKSGDVDGMQRLFMTGMADTSDMTADGFTALHFAAQNAHVELCRFLLDNACDVTATGPAGLTALHYAASWGQLEVVKLLVSTGKHDPTINDNFGFNALFQALYSPHISDPASRAKVLRWLVEQDDFVVDLNEKDLNGRTPLAMAARVEPSTALLLIENHANPHLTDNHGTSPLHNASASGFAEVVDALISVGVDVNPRNVMGQTPLFLAVESGHFPVVCRLLDAGANVNVKALPADTELHKAAEIGRVDIIERLLAAGADPNIKGLWAENALHRAAKKGFYAAVRIMLEAGGDINAKNEHGYTPLHKTTWGGKAEMLVQLMAHSKRLAHKDTKKSVSFATPPSAEKPKNNPIKKETQTVPPEKPSANEKKELAAANADDVSGAVWEELQTVILNNDMNGLKTLLTRPEVCENISVNDRWGVTALLTAAKEGNAAMVDLLIENGAEVEKQDWWGGTAMRRASDAWGDTAPGSEQNKFTEVIERLIAAGANVDAQDDEDGYTALHIAAANGRLNMVDFFLSRGASIQLRDWWGRTPVQIAAEARQFNAVNRLLDCGAKIEYRPDDKERLLLQSCENGIAELVESYLAEGVDVNSKGWLGETPLRVAAESNQLKIVDILIKAGANVDIEDMWRRTPLRRAAERGHTTVVERILQEGPNVNIVDVEDSDTAMHRAAENGHTDSVRLLLENKADPTIRNRWGRTELRRANQRSVTVIRRVSDDTGAIDEDDTEDKEINGFLGDLTGSTAGGHKGDTPLHRAAENGCLEVVNVILATGMSVNQKGRFGDSPLHHAAERGHMVVVERLLKEKPNLNQKGRYGDTPSMRAERHGNHDISDLLTSVSRSIPDIHRAVQSNGTEALEEQLTCGVDPDLRNFWDETPLHLAAAEGHYQLAVTLLQNKCKIDPKTERGDTPLALAAKYGHPKIVHLLLNAGANVNEKQRWGDTALHRAARFGHHGIVDRLIRGGAQVNVKDRLKDTPLHLACEFGHAHVVKSLLAAKADPRAIGRWEDTPLHRAAEHGDRQTVVYLLEADILVNARDKWKNTALHLAAKGHVSAVDALVLDPRVDTELKNKQGKTPLDLAAENGHDDVSARLVDAGVTWSSVGEYRNSQAQASKAERKPIDELHFKMMKRAIDTEAVKTKPVDQPAAELAMTSTEQKPASYPPLLASLSSVCVSVLRGEIQGAFSIITSMIWDVLMWTGAGSLVLTVGVFILTLERLTRIKPAPMVGNGTASESILRDSEYEQEKIAKRKLQAAFKKKLAGVSHNNKHNGKARA